MDLLAIRKGRLIQQGRNHPDLALLGPGDQSVLFFGHKNTTVIQRTFSGFPAQQGTIPPVKALGLRPDLLCLGFFGCKGNHYFRICNRYRVISGLLLDEKGPSRMKVLMVSV